MLGFSRGKTYITDFMTLADGRIIGLLTSGLLAGKVIVPDLERYREANSSLIERAAATLERLQKDRSIKVQIVQSELEPEELVNVARRSKAQIITVDREVKTDAVPVTRLDELCEALKPVYLSGNEIIVKIVKKGKEVNEGIGYLEGGVKVVVENAANMVGKEIEVVIVGSLDTAVGRVVFAKPRYTEVR